jgi:ABC-2 type transport system ATP-binding protein
LAPAIEVRDISRVFGTGPKALTALDGVSFDVAQGEIVALLGANGAGKTTLTKILATLLLPTGGSARVLGMNVVERVKEVRRHSGVVLGGDKGLYPRLSGRDNLQYFGMLTGMSRADLRRRVPAMLEDAGLAASADRRVETYSRGMRQRLHIAIALIARPRVLLLDEPTAGLDPMEADRLRDSVAGLCSEGVSVLLTSHYLLDAERLASRVVVLDKGKVTADQPLAQFAQRAGYAAVVLVRVRGTMPTLTRLLPAGLHIESCDSTGERTELTLRLREWDPGMFTHLGRLLDGADVTDVQVRPARLEEALAAVARPPAPQAAR